MTGRSELVETFQQYLMISVIFQKIPIINKNNNIIILYFHSATGIFPCFVATYNVRLKGNVIFFRNRVVVSHKATCLSVIDC